MLCLSGIDVAGRNVRDGDRMVLQVDRVGGRRRHSVDEARLWRSCCVGFVTQERMKKMCEVCDARRTKSARVYDAREDEEDG